MHTDWSFRLILTAVSCLVALATAGPIAAEPFNQGPEKCQECHKDEYKIWEGTKHFESFRTVHKKKEAKEIAEAIGDKNPRRSDTCVLCHYTAAQKDADAKPRLVAGPSCESCHGASSDWFAIHNDYGGKEVKRETETPEHKAGRREKAAAAGIIWPDETYRVATNCNGCHSMANAKLDGAAIDKMIAAGHPINPEFEYVRYSQGSVRHRYYPPNLTANQEMTPAELSQAFVIGHAAALVGTTAAMAKTGNEKFKSALTKRNDDARAALSAITSAIPAVEALLADPTDENASAFAAAAKGKDLSAQVGSMLPAKSTYK